MTLNVLMIAFWQAVAVFVLCLLAQNRGYAVLIGLAGCVVVTITGSYRYGWLDVLFVIAATLVAWNLTPQKEGATESRGNIAQGPAVGNLTPQKKGETPVEIAAFAGQAVGLGLVVLVAGWYLLSAQVKPDPVSPAPLSNQGGYVTSRSRSPGSGSGAIAVVPEASRPEREKQRVAGGEGRRGGDVRRCLDLKDNAAVARCVGG
ncbi:MAG: hypothetical protein JNK97_06265 [Zoogloea sp.]|nr:hypothetical protein [Zoogloea sp.]